MHLDLRIVEVGDPAPWPELGARVKHHVALEKVAILQGGMESGLPSVALLIELPDGSVVFVETSARLLDGIAAALRGACLRWRQQL